MSWIFLYIVVKLVAHKSLVSVLEDREVLKLLEEPWDVVGRYKETSKQHEWNDQNWGQGHSELFVGETGGNDEGVSTACIVNQDQNQ